MRAVEIIIKKKEGLSLTEEEICFIVNGYTKGSIPDYQVSALLMAICFNGLDDFEQKYLVKAMLESGEVNDLSQINGICVDKHSTGGVGDKTTLVIAPILACCGLKLAKMSGRGLGHTGGTLDKLESIPNFNISLSKEEFFNQVNEIGLAVVGQTANIAPADKKMYALRDVTGTVESIGLIAGSIMSKKLASGAHTILLDVKVGDGAFMKNIDDAKVLARSMVTIGNNFGRKTIAMLTDMDQPLGEAVGNSLEVIEAIETLKGKGPEQFTKLCYKICSEMLIISNIVSTEKEANSLITAKINSGEALKKLKEMIIFQKGNYKVIEDYSLFGSSKDIVPVISKEDGYVKSIKTTQIGNAAMILGAGRESMDDVIDPVVGIKVYKKVGDKVSIGEKIADVYTNGKNTNLAVEKVISAYEITNEKVNAKDIVIDVIGE